MKNVNVRAYKDANSLQKHVLQMLLAVSGSSGFVPYWQVRIVFGRNLKMNRKMVKPVLSELKRCGLIQRIGNRGIYLNNQELWEHGCKF